MTCARSVRSLIVICVAACPSFAFAQESVLSRTQELLQKADEEGAAAMNAAMQGDQATYQEHSARATELTSEARSLFDSANAAVSSDVSLLKAYAVFLREQGDYDLAESALLRAASMQPQNAEIWFVLGEVQSLLGASGEVRSVKSLRKALSLDAGESLDAKIHAALGALFYQQGLYDFARQSLESSLDNDANHIGARITLASLDVRDGQISAASDSLDALGEISPQSVSLMQRTMERALQDFEESRRWMPDTAENHLAYAKLLVRTGRMGESLFPLLRASELDPNNQVTWNLLGSVYRGVGNIEGARQAFSRSLALNPDQPRTRSALDELGPAQSPDSPRAPLAP
jgi:Flp pilus assembly protein TadD